jgi:hypothetical protein
VDTLVPTIHPASPPMESAAETALEDGPPRSRLTLRDAVRLCGMSEKTLRRKLEAGLLQGFRETLDYGGFMWMIEAHSLAELYPDSAQLRGYISQLEAQLNEKPADAAPQKPFERASEPARRPEAEARVTEGTADKPPQMQNRDFVLYLVEENRTLKEDLRERDIRLKNLQDRAFHLERECGEQRGTATTQARVLEWFQHQPKGQDQSPPGRAALPGQTAAAPTEVVASGPNQSARKLVLIGLLVGTLVPCLFLFIVQHLFRH